MLFVTNTKYTEKLLDSSQGVYCDPASSAGILFGFPGRVTNALIPRKTLEIVLEPQGKDRFTMGKLFAIGLLNPDSPAASAGRFIGKKVGESLGNMAIREHLIKEKKDALKFIQIELDRLQAEKKQVEEELKKLENKPEKK